METRTRADVVATHEPPGHGYLWGLTAGLVANAAIFIAFSSTPWVDEHVYDCLALGVLYAGLVVVGANTAGG